MRASHGRYKRRFPQPAGLVYYWSADMGNLAARGPNQAIGTFTNADAANRLYIGPDGLLKTAAANQPRFDWSTGPPLLLLEPAATQILTGTMPTTFTTAAGWNHTRLSAATPISATKLVGPTGAEEMSGIVGNTENNTHSVFSPYYAKTNNVPYTADVFISGGSVSWARVTIVYGAGGVYQAEAHAHYSLSGEGAVGAVASTPTTAIWRVPGTNIYHCKIRHTIDNAAYNGVRVMVFPAEADNDVAFAGDDSTVNLWVYGAYLRQTAFFDSPILTGSATRTTEAGSLTFPINAALAAALGTGGSFTSIMWAEPLCASTADPTYDGKFYSTDGTLIASVDAGAFSSGDDFIFVTEAYPSSFRVGYRKNAAAVSWGGLVDYDGDMPGSTAFDVFSTLSIPWRFKKIMILSRIPEDTYVNTLK